MKKTIISFIFLAFMMLGFTVQSQTLLLNEHFDYPVGDTIGSHGWAWHSGTSNFIGCVSGSLSYTGYPTSVGNMVFMNSSGEDANHSFTTQTAGSSIYVACLINVATASTTGDYFMHLKGASTTIFTGRIYIKKDATLNKFSIGLLKGSTAASTTYTSTLYDFATTHLIVLKYTIATGATNDSVSLFIDPSIANEGVPTIVASDLTSTDLDETSQAIALRQGTAANSLTLNVDEIRISNNWNVAIGFSGVVTAPVVLSVGANSITNTSAIVVVAMFLLMVDLQLLKEVFVTVLQLILILLELKQLKQVL